MSQLARTRSLVLTVALLALLPASAHAANGGASASGSASVRVSGGAAPGTVARAPARRRSRASARSRRRPRPHHVPVTAAAPPAPPETATLLPDGTAAAPAGAPAAVVAVIAAGDRIASLPYRWGGGHASWDDTGYDCSGSVGYALHGGGLLDATATSGDLMSYGQAGPGAWITIYTNPDHVYMVVAGLRFDTSGADPSRWQTAPRSSAGFVVRHPAGF